MNGNEGHWGGGISIISQNFPKSPSILFRPLESSISKKALKGHGLSSPHTALQLKAQQAIFRDRRKFAHDYTRPTK
jgi:hypothetical protein